MLLTHSSRSLGVRYRSLKGYYNINTSGCQILNASSQSSSVAVDPFGYCRTVHSASTPTYSARRKKEKEHNIWVSTVAGASLVGGITFLGAKRHFSSTTILCESESKKSSDDGNTSSFFSLASLPNFPKMPSLDSITPDLNVPKTWKNWSENITSLRQSFSDLQSELSKGPGSLFDRVIKRSHDAKVHPELEWDADVRFGTDLSLPERAFMRNRKQAMVPAFAKLMGVPESEVDPRDIPVIAIAASGGGYRAMVSTLGSISGAKESGVWDIISYASAVSGSCWALSMLYSIGDGNIERTIEHVKERIQTPFLDPSTVNLMSQKPTSEYLLGGALVKSESRNGDVSIVDAYGTLVSARLFVPTELTTLEPKHLKTSSQRAYIDGGLNPLPIYCAIRHEIPNLEALNTKADDLSSQAEKQKKNSKEAEAVSKEQKQVEEKKTEAVKQARWMWFEITPHEVGCHELGAWIPTWGFGRTFEDGKSAERLPEISMTILSGVYASAFCATLLSYYKEIKPLIKTIPFFSNWDEWLTKNYEVSLDSIHPFPPAELPNFLLGLDIEKLRKGASEDLTTLKTLGFMDAGANLNLPYVPLFRRDCDIILALDASADSQDLWFSRAEEYASIQGLRTWPRVSHASLFAESPLGDENIKNPSDFAAAKVDEAKAQEEQTTRDVTSKKVNEANPEIPPPGSAPRSKQSEQDSATSSSTSEEESEERDSALSSSKAKMPSSQPGEPPLGTCNIWIGSTKDEDSSCRNDDPSVEDVLARDGIALAYYPLMGNKEMGLEKPYEVWSTWKFEYTKEETEKLVALSKANFQSGSERHKELIRGVWMRKKKQRLENDKQQDTV